MQQFFFCIWFIIKLRDIFLTYINLEYGLIHIKSSVYTCLSLTYNQDQF